MVEEAKKKDEGKEEVKKEVPAKTAGTDLDTSSRVSGEGGVAVGIEDADMKEDILMPRIAILQGLSELVTEGKGSTGDLADSLS